MANSLSEMVQYAQAIQANSPLSQIASGVGDLSKTIQLQEEKRKKEDMELAEKVSAERRTNWFSGLGNTTNTDKTQSGAILASTGEAPSASKVGPIEQMAREAAAKRPGSYKLLEATLNTPVAPFAYNPKTDKITMNSKGEASITREDTGSSKTRLNFDKKTKQYTLAGTETVVNPNDYPNAVVDQVESEKPEKNYHYIDPVTKDTYITDNETGELVKGAPKKGSIAKLLPFTPEQRNESKEGIIPSGEVGRYTLAGEAIGSINDIRNILFPDGTPKSFNVKAAAKSKIPLLGSMPKDKEGQRIYRKMSTALTGRQLIQTGVAAREDETRQLTKSFAAGLLSDPEAAFESLTQLEDFYRNYRGTLESKKSGEFVRSDGKTFGGNNTGKPHYKDGDTRSVNGVTLVRKNGKWTNQ